MTRIGILGIGGVGGYFGGLLAEKYKDSSDVSIIFIARPETAQVIREHGLKIITPDDERTIQIQHVATNTEEAGILDVLICATKNYDLEEALLPLRGSINSETIMLPLLNGVVAKERISAWFPENEVLDGCVYINARRTAPGVISKKAMVEKLYFGTKNSSRNDLDHLQEIFKAAGIESILSDHIETDVWDKYIFITALATVTTYYDQQIHKLLANPEQKSTLVNLIQEAVHVAVAKDIALPENMEDRTMGKIKNLPAEAMSSMHSDFLSGGKTEYRSLTKYITDLGDEYGIDTPVYDKILEYFTGHLK